MKCKTCQEDVGGRPHDIVVQHRAECILVYAICSKPTCWEEMGKRMAEGNR